MKRIRYFKKDNYSESETLLMGNRGVISRIFDDNRVMIYDSDTGEVLFDDMFPRSRAEAMKLAKEFLKDNGVLFEDECRKVIRLKTIDEQIRDFEETMGCSLVVEEVKP